MKDIEKIKKLIEHWAEHNIEHAKTYYEWAEKAKASGNNKLYEILLEISDMTKKMDHLFQKAKDLVK